MTELINALTRLANAAALYFEQQTHPKIVLPEAEGERIPAEPKVRKARAPKAPEAPAPIAALPPGLPPAPQQGVDPMLAELGLAPAPAPAAPPQPQAPATAPVLTAEQSTLEMKKIAVKCVQAFKNDTPNGEVRLTALLAENYKVARLGDLTHTQRLDFLVKVQALLTAGGKA